MKTNPNSISNLTFDPNPIPNLNSIPIPNPIPNPSPIPNLNPSPIPNPNPNSIPNPYLKYIISIPPGPILYSTCAHLIPSLK